MSLWLGRDVDPCAVRRTRLDCALRDNLAHLRHRVVVGAASAHLHRCRDVVLVGVASRTDLAAFSAAFHAAAVPSFPLTGTDRRLAPSR